MTEGGSASFTVNASPSATGAITVRYTVSQSGQFVSAGNRGSKTVSLSGTSTTITVPTQNDSADEPNGLVTVTLNDGTGYTVSSSQRAASVTVNDDDTGDGGSGGGGFVPGGGGPSGPVPSEDEFAWNVTGDLEALDPANSHPTGILGEGGALLVLQNGPGSDDGVFAYELATGERLEERDIELAGGNRAPRGLDAEGGTLWVSDSGRDRLFAYDLATGERLEERDIELADGNRAARGIWAGGGVIYVLDGVAATLFAYDAETGEPVGRYDLDRANGDPRGLWSDGVSAWVSDHAAKRIFAYRLQVPAVPGSPAAEDGAEPAALERERQLEFDALTKAGNLSPRGLWSDGALLYVVDALDGRVYSYNMPAAIDARLASLALEGVAIGVFSALRTEYEAVAEPGLTSTTVEATAARPGASVLIEPGDADAATPGHQAALGLGDVITVTVTSRDGTRTRVYRVSRRAPPTPRLLGEVAAGFSLLVFEGGPLEQLAEAAERRHVTALYALEGGRWLTWIARAPDFVNAAFAGRFAEGLPAGTVLVAASEGPATQGDPAGAEPPQEWPRCLEGEIVAAGFSLVRFAGGSPGELAECASRLGVAALYTLRDGEWLAYIPAAPDFVNRAFAERFAGGLPVGEPLAVRGAGETESER